MMRNKLYLLLAILSIFVICLASADEKTRKTDNVKNSKKKKLNEETPVLGVSLTDDLEREDYDDEIDDSYTPRSSFAHNRFLSYDPSETNYRTRSRWPSTSGTGFSPSLPTLPFTVGEFPDDDEWATSGYENTLTSPFSPASYNTQRVTPNGPTCSSLIDPQYPIFSDTCGAVPQARYSLPNAFGHRDKWQIAQLLSVLASTETDPTCTRSTRLLLCPILFPSCPSRHQPAPVLPCQSYCRAVKARCASPLLENLPCEILPITSDICPTNQGYSPLAPPRNFPLNMQSPLPMTAGHPSSRQLSTLQSLLSSPAFQAALSGQGYPAAMNPQALQTAFGAQAFPSPFQPQNFQPQNFQPQNFQPQNFQQQSFQPENFQPTAMPAPTAVAAAPTPVATPSPPLAMPATTPMSFFSNMQFPIDTISAMLGELPSHPYATEHRPVPRYGLGARSSNEARSTNDFRGSSNARTSGSTSMIRA